VLHFDKLRQARTGFRFNLYEERRELFLASDADAPAASQADFRKLRLSRISVKTRESRSSGRTNRHVPRSPSHERKQRRIVSAFGEPLVCRVRQQSVVTARIISTYCRYPDNRCPLKSLWKNG
jgi:hypothetical protein